METVKYRLSYHVLREKYKQLQIKHRSEINDKDKDIKKLKKKIESLNEEIIEKNKKIKEKDLIIGWLADKKH